ncbi:MAG: hypothetical protein JXM70_29365, partial [Pirellulales bacterium]|nr:hypothetical protein [Pirellulales bacterium]
MKYHTSSKSKRRRDTVSVSLFPFLAVLICTMGVLILLLVIFTHQARLQAAEEARRKIEEESVAVSGSREDVREQIDLLNKSREETKKHLAEVRLKLGLVEDHERQLREKLKQLESTRQQMEQMQADGVKRKQLEAELAEIEANIKQVKADIEESKRQAKSQSRVFRPVVPTEGYDGTTRIPICVECRGDTVVIQPEGIVLTEADFEGSMGPGNPLAAALRAAREHMLVEMGKAVTDNDISRIEPYPLLLVRPDGTMSYNCVRHAMKSWGPDFGYELIDDDWKIDYGQPNPQRALAMQEALDAARLQQIRLAEAAPRHYSESDVGPIGTSRYTTSGNGGVVAYHGKVRKSTYRTPGERLAERRAALGGTSPSGGDPVLGDRYASNGGPSWAAGGTGSAGGTEFGSGTGGQFAGNSASTSDGGLGGGNGTAGGNGNVGGTGLGSSMPDLPGTHGSG